MEIAAGKFKIHCLKLMEDIQKNREEIIITKRGRPVAKLVPIDEGSPEPLVGYLKGSVTIVDDILEPVGENWNADR